MRSDCASPSTATFSGSADLLHLNKNTAVHSVRLFLVAKVKLSLRAHALKAHGPAEV
jgi:hypothetical protein